MDLPCCSICWLSLVYGKPLSSLSTPASTSSPSTTDLSLLLPLALRDYLLSFTYWRDTLPSVYLYNPTYIQMYSPVINDLIQYILTDTTLLPEPLPEYPLHMHDLRRLLLKDISSSSSSFPIPPFDKKFLTPSIATTSNRNSEEDTSSKLTNSSEHFSKPLSVFEPALIQAIQTKYKYSLVPSSSTSTSSSSTSSSFSNSSSSTKSVIFFMKINGKCPLDSITMNEQGLMITNISQLYTLCSTSNLVRQAIHISERLYATLQPYFTSSSPSSTTDLPGNDSFPSSFHNLLITRYRAPHRSSEFRIFIRNYQVRGISQRHTSECFPALSEISRQKYVEYVLPLFYQQIVRPNVAIPSLAMDCVVNENMDIFYQLNQSKSLESLGDDDDDELLHVQKLFKEIKIMDIVPADATLDTLLFEWEELYGTAEEGGNILPCGHPTLDSKTDSNSLNPSDCSYQSTDLPLLIPFLRIVTNTNIRFHPLASHGLPLDIQEMAYDKVYNSQNTANPSGEKMDTVPVAMVPPRVMGKNTDDDDENEDKIHHSFVSTDGPTGSSTNPSSNGMGWSSMIDQLQSLGLFYRPNDNDDDDDSGSD